MLEGVAQILALVEEGGRLAELSSEAKAFGTSNLASRLLKKSDGNLRRASCQFESALRWCEVHKELLKHRHFALSGDERVMGLNMEGRPVIYLCMKNQMLSSLETLDQKVCTMMHAVDCMPDGIDNVVQIWDMHGMAFRTSDLNVMPLIKEFLLQESFFAERLHEIVIVGMPRMASLIKDVAWNFVPDRTRRKIRFLSDEVAADRYVAGTCDELLAGRILGSMRDNRNSSLTLEQRRSSWQCIDQLGRLVPLTSVASSAPQRGLL